jgi:hypothetical protein
MPLKVVTNSSLRVPASGLIELVVRQGFGQVIASLGQERLVIGGKPASSGAGVVAVRVPNGAVLYRGSLTQPEAKGQLAIPPLSGIMN